MASLLQLLASQEGSTYGVVTALAAGAPIDEVHPRTKEGVLHVLFRRCVRPLELYSTVKVLLEHGADVNLLDYRGATPLSLLVLHVNHGLRYHSYPLPEIQRLEDLAAPKAQLQWEMAALDALYQDQVYLSLELLLTAGADVNAIPDVVPALPASTEWVDAYEHKLVQQEGRWNLLGYDTSMEFSTYNIFNPISSHRCLNDQRLTPLHLAAWRGDARCIRLLLDHGADAKAITDENKSNTSRAKAQNPLRCISFLVEHNTASGKGHACANTKNRAGPSSLGGVENLRHRRGRGALHFLYLYCNKPKDLIKATRALLAGGADPNVCHLGDSPAHVLIPHVLVKRTYHQYLSNTFHLDELRRPPSEDNYISELASCLLLLADASPATPVQGLARRTLWDSLMLRLFSQFEHILINTDKSFQPRGHYLVPYTFQVDAVTQFAEFLISQGCKVNMSDNQGQTPLHHLVSSIQNLSTDPNLNSSAAICRCFRSLLDSGADCNRKGIFGKTPVFSIVLLALETINSQDGPGFELLSDVLDLMTSYGGDLNDRDCLSATPLVRTVMYIERALRCRNTRKSSTNLKRFLQSLLLNGADPNEPWSKEEANSPHLSKGNNTYILDVLFDHHFELQLHESDLGSEFILSDVIPMVSVCMRQSLIRRVVRRLWDKHWPFTEDYFAEDLEEGLSQCADCSLVALFSREPFSLKLTCRQVLIKSMPGPYKQGVSLLPLPAEIKRYLVDLSAL